MPYKNREDRLAAQKRHYLQHKEQYYARVKQSRAKNPEKWKEYHRRYNEKKKYQNLQEWYNTIKENIKNGISTKTLPIEEQEKFWSMLMFKANNQ